MPRVKPAKAIFLTVPAVGAALGLPTCAAAQEATRTPDWNVAYNLGAQSNYVFRGISQTSNRPSVFAGIDVTYKNQLYVGAWTSNVDFKPSGDYQTNQEIDLYAGWRPPVDAIDVDLGYIYYGYRNQPEGLRETYWEYYLKGNHAFGPFTPGAAIYASPNFPGTSGESTYYELNASYAFNRQWSVSGAAGRQFEANALQTDGGARDFVYTTWNVGLSYTLNAHATFDLRYWDTNQHDLGRIYSSHVVLLFKATF